MFLCNCMPMYEACRYTNNTNINLTHFQSRHYPAIIRSQCAKNIVPELWTWPSIIAAGNSGPNWPSTRPWSIIRALINVDGVGRRKRIVWSKLGVDQPNPNTCLVMIPIEVGPSTWRCSNWGTISRMWPPYLWPLPLYLWLYLFYGAWTHI